jgi:TonB family protein
VCCWWLWASATISWARARPDGGATPRGSGDIAAQVRAHIDQVNACYQGALAKQPELAGQVIVHFSISGGGVVRQVDVETSTLKSPAVEDCIVRAARQWKFRPTADGQDLHAAFPFTFEATSSASQPARSPALLARRIIDGASTGYSRSERLVVYNHCWREAGGESCALVFAPVGRTAPLEHLPLYRASEIKNPALRDKKVAAALSRLIPRAKAGGYVELRKHDWAGDRNASEKNEANLRLPDMGLVLRWSRGKLRVSGPSLKSPLIREVGIARGWSARPTAVFTASDQSVLVLLLHHDRADGASASSTYHAVELPPGAEGEPKSASR